MNIEALFHKHKLDDLERKILQYLYDNIHSIKKIGIRKVAKDNFTSTSMVYKLSNKLGFSGYADMIHYISYSYNENTEALKRSNYTELYNSVISYKEDFNSLLNEYKNKRIIVIGMGFSSIISNFISESLFLKGFNSASNLHMELLSPKYKDDILLITISQSGETTRMVEIIKEARKNEFKVINFTSNKNSSLPKLSTLSITIGNINQFKNVNPSLNTFFGELLLAFDFLIL
ncbi:MAG: MurR/RpiR family transcriptional regulator [Clostridium sp.]